MNLWRDSNPQSPAVCDSHSHIVTERFRRPMPYPLGHRGFLIIDHGIGLTFLSDHLHCLLKMICSNHKVSGMEVKNRLHTGPYYNKTWWDFFSIQHHSQVGGGVIGPGKARPSGSPFSDPISPHKSVRKHQPQNRLKISAIFIIDFFSFLIGPHTCTSEVICPGPIQGNTSLSIDKSPVKYECI